MRNLQSGVWQMSLAMLISGSIGVFVLLSGLPVIDVVFWRCVIGAGTLLVVIRYTRQPLGGIARKRLLLAIAGGVALVLNWLLLFAAYSRLSIGLATVVYNTQPFMLVLMSMLLGESVSRMKWGWLLLSFSGIVLLLLSDIKASSAGITGIAMALGAAFFYALTALIARRLTSLTPLHIAFIQVLTGVVMLLPLAHLPAFDTAFPWGMLLTLGIVHTGIMYQLLYSALQKLPTPVIGSLSFIYPLVAVVLDALLFGHTLSPLQMMGGIVILLAAAGNNLGWGERTKAASVVSRCQ
ncbi:DMT family transporter [Vagococcus sp. WN89Y]|uniref:DMT family transporter n=1 Tax=Vagococcus sp. WN89Y TaxID=3457258 RepID=UPI003FCCC294